MNYFKEITNRDLLYRRGNYMQYFVTTYKGKKSEKEYIYIYVKLNYFAIHLKLTQCGKSTIPQFKNKNPLRSGREHENKLSSSRDDFLHLVSLQFLEIVKAFCTLKLANIWLFLTQYFCPGPIHGSEREYLVGSPQVIGRRHISI